MYSCSLHLLVWEWQEKSFSWLPEGVESACSIARVIPCFYLFPTVAPVQPGRQGLPVTGPDCISVPTYSLPRVYVLLLFSVGVLWWWWCSTSLRSGTPVRRCRTRSLGSRRVWMLFLILFQALLAIVSDTTLCEAGLVVLLGALLYIQQPPDRRHPSPDK